jgi:hypothetical protein
MKPFHTIAVPHKDILEGRLTMDVFAADLWEVSKNRGPDEYKDAETFFRKTYLTHGLENLLNIVEKRLPGKGGDPVIQIQTPFGGGKTHSLIAMYHRAAQWDAKKVVMVGTAMGTDETLWGSMEKQLTGKITRFSGQVTPGKEAIRNLLDENQLVLILMDEVLEYVTKAAGVKVEKSTLASQTIAFMQELTEAAGRVEKIYTPVQENEITKIIRRRLFGDISENGAKKTVVEFMEYAEKEGILPAGKPPTEYRDRFLDSYPFMPEVVDILYQGLNLGSRTATSIFLNSFSGGYEKGTTTGEIKRCATTTENPASVVAEAAEQLKGKLFHLQNIGEKYYFSN